MTPDIKIFLLCPIPEDQKPINEYIDFKENILTNWTKLSTKIYIKNLCLTYFFFFSIFSIFSFNELLIIFKKDLFDWFLIKFLLSFLSLFFYLIFILFRWITINNKFQTPRIIYEEASWYDGQIWEKPFFLIKNDKLLSSQKINPIIQRLIRTNFSCLFILLGFVVIFEIF
jgi:hypothetical protein